jgi:hypothetical protein
MSDLASPPDSLGRLYVMRKKYRRKLAASTRNMSQPAATCALPTRQMKEKVSARITSTGFLPQPLP